MENDLLNQAAFTDRILQVEQDPNNEFSYLEHFENTVLVSLDVAIKKLFPLIGSFEGQVNIAKEMASKNENDQLTIDESAAIYFYTMSSTSTSSQPFYIYLNDALRSTDWKIQKSYFPYLKLFISALSKLEPVALSVARGAKMDLSEKYSIGKTFVWSTFSSCASHGKTLFTNPISDISESRTRTIFRIHCLNARNIRPYSILSNEDEYILLPGTQFKVISMISPSKDFHIIEIQEIQPTYLLRQGSLSISKSDKSFPQEETNDPHSITETHSLESINEKLHEQCNNTEGIFALSRINDEEVTIIGNELKTNKTWTRLDLCSNKISGIGLSELSPALVLNTTLKILTLEDNMIVDYGIRLLVDALKQNSTLESLTLIHNEIGEAGASYLADLLSINTTLIELRLDDNLIRSKGMNSICKILEQYNRTLRKFSVKSNDIKNASVDSIVNVYAMNYILEEFEYNLNEFSDDDRERFRQAKEQHEKTRRIHNEIGSMAVFYLEWKNLPEKSLSREASLIFPDFQRLTEPKRLKTIDQNRENLLKKYLILSSDDETTIKIISKYCQQTKFNLLILQTTSNRDTITFNCEDALIYRLVTQIAQQYRTYASNALQNNDKFKARIYRQESIDIQQRLVIYMKKRREFLFPKTDANQHSIKSLIVDVAKK